MSDSGEEKRKIIIDEDWKSQVEQERASLKDPSASAGDRRRGRRRSRTLPCLPLRSCCWSRRSPPRPDLPGANPGPVDNTTVVRVDLARHYIELLEMLDEKTRGNLTEEENSELQEILHQLRMVYVMVKQSGA